ncbi:MAG: phage integrase N-terminal SAM-like domain-containing protein, partial [Planctomycetia bacterium]
MSRARSRGPSTTAAAEPNAAPWPSACPATSGFQPATFPRGRTGCNWHTRPARRFAGVIALEPSRPVATPPRLLDHVRAVARARHLAANTQKSYVRWIRRFIVFHGRRHPREMGVGEVNTFLTHLAVDG